MTMHGPSRQQRGISLIEALVALVIMAFGTMAVLGVQATLRINGDIAKQRAEAVRIGQATMERLRAFASLEGNAADTVYYNDIDDTAETVAGLNASYAVTVNVPPESTDPRYKTVSVEVAWEDRAGVAQTIRLSSALFGAAPELAGTLSTPANGSPHLNPRGRNPGVPPGAITIEGDRSSFTPPGAPDGVRWIFDNNTGFIVQTCISSICTPYPARLLAGFVRFSTGNTPNSEIPDMPKLAGLQVSVVQTLPTAVAGTVQCFVDPLPVSYVSYNCAVPVDVQTRWSGRSGISGTNVATFTVDDVYRVCRYTPYRDGHPGVPADMTNEEHPLFYVNVEKSLFNQNFLVIRAPNECPADIEGTPVNGTTWRHQPSS